MHQTLSPALSPRPGGQAWLFQKLRYRLVRNAGSLAAGGSRVRLISIVLCSLLVSGSVFVVSWEGFRLLQKQNIPFAGGIIGVLLDFLFLSLGVMLFFSSAIILYGSLFSSPETTFLLSTPARADQIFAFKFQTAVAFSSWAFVLLGLPILVAYGGVYAVSLDFFLLLPLYLIGFVLLPGSLGAVGCFAVVNFVPQRRKQVLALAGLVLLALAAGWGYNIWRTARATLTGREGRDALQLLFGQFAFAKHPLVPSHWMTQGLQAAARGDIGQAGFRLAMLWSNGLFLYVFAALVAKHLYRRGYNRLWTGGSLRKRYGGAWMDRSLTALLAPFDPQMRLLIVKDFRTFRRDPTQWAQILLFGGLMLLVCANLRQFYRSDLGRPAQQVVSLLNVCATAMLTCASMGRFVYPMLSLEGRKFWVLGLLPLKREQLLWGKFVFAATGSVIVAEVMVLVSDLILGMPPVVFGLHAVTVVVLAAGLSGLSVGLGAAMPNFRENDPSKIAVGFGGTLNLIVGLLFLTLIIGLMVLPYHWMALIAHEEAGVRWRAIVPGLVAGLAVGFLGTYLPLRLGERSLKGMEF